MVAVNQVPASRFEARAVTPRCQWFSCSSCYLVEQLRRRCATTAGTCANRRRQPRRQCGEVPVGLSGSPGASWLHVTSLKSPPCTTSHSLSSRESSHATRGSPWHLATASGREHSPSLDMNGTYLEQLRGTAIFRGGEGVRTGSASAAERQRSARSGPANWLASQA